MLPSLLVFVAVMNGLSAAPVQETHPTTPALTSHEAFIELSHEAAMARAKEALQAAGLTLHTPGAQTQGASHEWVFALINCFPVNDKIRVTTSVAAHPSKRNEAPRISFFLIEYMRTGKPPANPGLVGIWEWDWQSYTTSGKIKVTLKPDGTATADAEGWENTIWWSEGDKVMVYWPSPFPKTNLHYVQVLTLAADGRSMASSIGNYYFKSVTAARVGDLSATTAPPPGGGTAAPPDQIVGFGSPSFPPAPLPLPPVGARSPKTAPVSDSPDVQTADTLESITLSHVPNSASGHLKVDLTFSGPARNIAADVYVGGFITNMAEMNGHRNVGMQPSYAYRSLIYADFMSQPGGGSIRSHSWPTPWVLPAKVRVELYAVAPDGKRTFLSQQEKTFDLPWKDYKVETGGILGDDKTMKITRIFATVTEGTTGVRFTLPNSHPTNRDNDHGISGIFAEGKNEFSNNLNIDVRAGSQWPACRVDVSPIFMDRDLRNNTYWPRMPGNGYADLPPIWAGF